MLEISVTNQYLKDLKTAKKRGLDIQKLYAVVRLIVEEIPLPPQYKDHKLIGDFVRCRECHVQPDWLLVYSVDKAVSILCLIPTGSHSDLF